MGFQTRYLGTLTIDPPLRQDEIAWLRAFELTSPSLRPEDPYYVPMNPRAEWDRWMNAPENRTGTSDRGRSRPQCDWAPSTSGTHLEWQRRDTSNRAVQEITYLIEHFLKPGALASKDGRRDFDTFTFDHEVNGVIAAERSDGWLYLIRVKANEVTQDTLVTAPEIPYY